MDGRNLANSIILKWTPEISLIDIANTIPIFIKKVLTSKVYEFYGEFCLNSVYNLKNYQNMLVNNFPCHIDNDVEISNLKKIHLFYKDKSNFLLIISDDCLILFKQLEPEGEINYYGKIVFWALLFSINDLQINKDKKVVRINFYDNDRDTEVLRLKISNILYFKETLIKKMSNLKIKTEINKLVKGNYIENKITMRDINNMDIEEIEDYIQIFKHKIENDIINYYIVDTFSLLSGKAIEHYSKIKSEKQITFLLQVKNVLQRENVQNILNKNKNIDKQLNSENNNEDLDSK
jgi:hypothetical protein